MTQKSLDMSPLMPNNLPVIVHTSGTTLLSCSLKIQTAEEERYKRNQRPDTSLFET